MKVVIINNNVTTTLDFDDKSYGEFKEAIQNCIDKPDEYTSINYKDPTDEIIFSSGYLKNSLIKFPRADREYKERTIVDYSLYK